jgi:hypothetical protein
MPRGASPEREREYEELKEEFEEEGRYPGREEEVAARIVNKQRAEYGETKDARESDRKGKSPDRSLPIPNYNNLTVDEVAEHLDDLSEAEIEKIKHYEQGHKNRKSLLELLNRQ